MRSRRVLKRLGSGSDCARMCSLQCGCGAAVTSVPRMHSRAFAQAQNLATIHSIVDLNTVPGRRADENVEDAEGRVWHGGSLIWVL